MVDAYLLERLLVAAALHLAAGKASVVHQTRL
jgi:hypothetical protein